MMKHLNVTAYFLWTWLVSIFLSSHFLGGIPSETVTEQLHMVLLLLTYGAMYQGPALLGYWLLRRWRRVAVPVAVGLALLGHIFVFFDSRLYDLYAFHLNGFVWNLLTTPGGLDSLGADQTSALLVGRYAALLLAIHLFGLLLAAQVPGLRLQLHTVVILFLVATGAERGIYGYSQAVLSGHILERGDAMALYQPMRMNSFLAWLGVDVKKSADVKVTQVARQLFYPKHELVVHKVAQPLNIVMLVSESMRWDLLNPEIMPNMAHFAEKSWNFSEHYSGGNGTRQGMFALFYGIQGNSWDMFLRNKQGPVLFDVLNQYDYQYFIYTSAKFTYPEFDHTIFSQIPREKLVENNQGEPWRRDEANTTALIREMENRDRAKPFFGFLFYEATHARYSFAEHAVVRPDYRKNFDYAGLSRDDLAPQMPAIKARYENAAHGIDGQLQRVVSCLEQSGDLDSTVIIVTGDHGEEFMERGRWGHNSAFTDWQVRVPMIVWMPGRKARIIRQRTSHMDVGPTLLRLLGVENPVRDYSLGLDLASPQAHRNIIVASWSDIGLINDFGKLVIPFKATTQHHNLATDLNDHPLDAGTLAVKMQEVIVQVLGDAHYYSK